MIALRFPNMDYIWFELNGLSCSNVSLLPPPFEQSTRHALFICHCIIVTRNDCVKDGFAYRKY